MRFGPVRGIRSSMEYTVLHIVGGGSRARAEQARVAFALGHHAEVYADIGELLERPPKQGIVLAEDDGAAGAVASFLDRSAEKGLWLPVVMTAADPAIERVVAAIRAGAIDYLALPLEMNSFARRLSGIQADGERYAERREVEVRARMALDTLSPREREVLQFLSAGHSNKEIARVLAISPRTVEIHRGNMMTKLGARHVAQAVRLWIEAEASIDGGAIQMDVPETPKEVLNDWLAAPGLTIPKRAVMRR